MEKVINVKVAVTVEPTHRESDQELAAEALNDAFIPAYVELDDPAVVNEEDA